MSRELKFRAWDKLNNKMVGSNFFVTCFGLPVDAYNPNNDVEWQIMQYTGLNDKNGKEIYEGDICLNHNKQLMGPSDDSRLYLVQWVDGEFGTNKYDGIMWLKSKPGFVFKKVHKGIAAVFSQEQIEVIGNIYETPELLK